MRRRAVRRWRKRKSTEGKCRRNGEEEKEDVEV